MHDWKYICCAGGGNLGLLYIGALQGLNDEFYKLYGTTFSEYIKKHVHGIAGTSIGALFALSLVLNTKNLRELCIPYVSSFDTFMHLPDIRNISTKFGLDEGKRLRELVSLIFKDAKLQDTVTFSDLFEIFQKDFQCCATDLNKNEPVYFSAAATPEVRVIDALYMSMTVPLLFVPEKFNNHIMIDGALSDNIPRVFPAKETLFFVFEECCNESDIEVFTQFTNSLMKVCLNATTRNDETLLKQGTKLILYIPNSIKDDNQLKCLSDNAITERIRSGYASVLQYFHPQTFFICGNLVKIFTVFLVSTASSSNNLFDC